MGVHRRIAQQVQVVKYLLLVGSSVLRPFRAVFTNAAEFVNDTRRRTTSYPECKWSSIQKWCVGVKGRRDSR